MDVTVVSGSELHLTPTALDPAVTVLGNGLGSMFTIFMQFLPAIILFSIVLFIIFKMSNFSFGKKHGGVSSFKTSIKN